jgi:O-acetyl-ADP-ribose deacetylase (regulator of RNase III)
MSAAGSLPRGTSVLHADITTLDVAAIVNAANSALAGGGGVDGAIHRAAGSRELLEACRPLSPCPTGEARLTPGFRLKARHIIHTVGPVWQGGGAGERGLLGKCYRSSLEIAARERLDGVAFPAISTGIYRFPLREACEIAARECVAWLAAHDYPKQVVFCMYDTIAYDEMLAALAPHAQAGT